MKPLTLLTQNNLLRKWSTKRNNKKKTPKRPPLSKDQESAMSSLSEYASRNFEVQLEDDGLRTLLDDNSWNLKRAMAELDDREEAYHGLLHGPPAAGQALLGCENDGGTSCYIDSLLFAMYTSLTAFDPLLTYDTSSDQPEKGNLQVSLRLFVNIMRKGDLVKKHVVRSLRKALENASWRGRNERGFWKQEDASELLLFLTETFDLPYLPFQMRLFHGANRDMDDDRVTTDRVLSLSIPSETNSQQPLRLEDILFEHFYSSIVTGVKRQVDWHDTLSQSPPGSPTSAISQSSITKTNITFTERRQREIAVNAWQVLELLPFYSGISEQGVRIESQNQGSFPDSRMVLPIILKRYRCTSLGRYVKDQRSVIVPASIHFNKFLNQNAEDPVCETCGRKVEGIMRLRSVVCHKGASPHSGHYIAYSRTVERDNEVWLKLDDLASSQRVKSLGREHEEEIYRELGKDGYLFFYELDKACEHTTDDNADLRDDGRRASSSTTGTAREERAGILQKIHKVEENSAPMQNEMPPSLPPRLPTIKIPPNLPPRSPPAPLQGLAQSPRPSAELTTDTPQTPVSPVSPTSPTTKNSTTRSRTKSFRRSKDNNCKTM